MATVAVSDSARVVDRSAAVPPFPARDFAVPSIILAILAGAELTTAAIDARIGLGLHAILLGVLVVLGVRTTDTAKRELYWALTLAPVIRIGSLSMPLGRLPLMEWYPLIGVPLFSATFFTAYRLGYTRQQLGLTINFADMPRQLAMVALGALLGIGEYLIFRPAPLAERFTLEAIAWPAFILLVFTGLEEELIFRGLMQRASLRALGRWGLIYVNLIFAVLHIGYLSVLDVVFVFLVGFLFSLFVLRTKSLFGVTIAHGGVNIVLFLILPYLAPIVLGTGYADLLPLPAPVAPRE
ncbi:MAG: CPBP family intramembrane metalloprotease [Chloroflexota bacterium]|nr:MAG: CPBP family intramembrane metalloprotease [Chloroflexota bacterium]